MSKLQRAVEGQTIQFLPLPKIFNTLSADLPSGAVKLPNGDVAYWRLHRNLAELKKHRKNVKELTTRLAQALQALVNSDSFKNHYGITEAPSLPSESQLVTLFRNLLQLNTNRVDYSSVSHGNKKPLVETIQVPLGNLVFFNAIRGVQSAPKVAGIKGKLWLKEGSDADQAFAFTIVSPVVELADFIGPDRLQAEILNKIKVNLPTLAFNPKITFDEDQFKNYVGAGLQALGEKFQGQQNGNSKKAKNTPKQSGQHVDAPKVEAPVVEEQPADEAELELGQDAGAAQFVGEMASQEVDPITMNASQAAQIASDARDVQRQAELGTVVLCAQVFEELSTEDKGVYLAAVERKISDPANWPFVNEVLNSGILASEYKNLNDTFAEGEKISHAVYIARVIFQLTNDMIAKITGEFKALEQV
ncbi:hypothetical protein [Ralstonia phage RSF1]|uniref:Uncharacterized protein n=1 Tax=Ralstonia phage RSF1 TaxID=1689679 RepID=A0A0K2QQY0_9CAUD|nr:hypothetical protein AVU11_gp166 [Ralstonia phage RSF1]BAS04958.1 hypothetical protein [Ralstonia phage RSF1]